MKYSLKTNFLQIKSTKLSLPYCLIGLFFFFFIHVLPSWPGLTFRGGNDLSLAELSNLHTLISAHFAAALVDEALSPVD